MVDSGLRLLKTYNQDRVPVIAHGRIILSAGAFGPHPWVQVVFVLDGWAHIDTTDRHNTLTSGTIVTIPSGASPRLQPLGLLRIVVFHLNPGYLASQLRWLPHHHPLVHHLRRSLQDSSTLGRIEIPPYTMRALTPRLLRATQLSRTADNYFALLGAAAEIFDIVGKASGTTTFTPSVRKRMPRCEIAAAARLLHSYPDQPWTVGKLAETVCLSVSQLNRAFRADLGISPSAYLHHVRVDRMAELLSSTNIGVSEAARVAGWTSPAVATRAFKRRYGVSPRDFTVTPSRTMTEAAVWERTLEIGAENLLRKIE